MNRKFTTPTFEYISNKSDREMFTNAWQSIHLTEMWDFAKDDIDHFMCNSNDKCQLIINKMYELGYYSHSGSSFAFTMRAMQYLAINGESQFKKYYNY
jgi:hypothetical protein